MKLDQLFDFFGVACKIAVQFSSLHGTAFRPRSKAFWVLVTPSFLHEPWQVFLIQRLSPYLLHPWRISLTSFLTHTARVYFVLATKLSFRMICMVSKYGHVIVTPSLPDVFCIVVEVGVLCKVNHLLSQPCHVRFKCGCFACTSAHTSFHNSRLLWALPNSSFLATYWLISSKVAWWSNKTTARKQSKDVISYEALVILM